MSVARLLLALLTKVPIGIASRKILRPAKLAKRRVRVWNNCASFVLLPATDARLIIAIFVDRPGAAATSVDGPFIHVRRPGVIRWLQKRPPSLNICAFGNLVQPLTSVGVTVNSLQNPDKGQELDSKAILLRVVHEHRIAEKNG